MSSIARKLFASTDRANFGFVLRLKLRPCYV
jgi:hypothetical protein